MAEVPTFLVAGHETTRSDKTLICKKLFSNYIQIALRQPGHSLR